jgi:two-component system KDP operon response regulator KdpE
MDSIQGKKILIIDDDPDICELIEQTLSRTGAQVLMATDGEDGLRQFETHPPDLVLLDIMMPGLDGLAVCSRMLNQTVVPIIFLTALGHEAEIVDGLELGAIDYVTKPFSPRVLVARIRAALRQVTLASSLGARLTYSDDHLNIDLAAREVLVRGERVTLTVTEHRLLAYLLRNAGRVLAFDEILENVWGAAYHGSPNYVHVYVCRLRQKLERDPARPDYLLSEHGVGYRFAGAEPG